MGICDYQHFYSHLSSAEKTAAPKELYMEGDCALLYSGIRVSVVGSRKVSAAGIRRTWAITKILVDMGLIVVSGLAEGVDTVAHKTAIEYGGRTIAVLGTPLDRCSPVANRDLLENIKRDHLAISQFAPGSPVNKSNFPYRNKTMALVSDATIIVEATENSGTRHQAWEAIRLNRKVFLMENVANDKSITWAQQLLSYGAEVLTRDNHTRVLSSLLEFA